MSIVYIVAVREETCIMEKKPSFRKGSVLLSGMIASCMASCNGN